MDKLAKVPFLTDLRKINQDSGVVMHAIKASSTGFEGFGEAYFSTVSKGMVKGWKLHSKMTLNIVVPCGEIRFIIHDGCSTGIEGTGISPIMDIALGINNYKRLTVPPNYWMAFIGLGDDLNLLMNVADIEHDPCESVNKNLNEFRVNGFED